MCVCVFIFIRKDTYMCIRSLHEKVTVVFLVNLIASFAVNFELVT